MPFGNPVLDTITAQPNSTTKLSNNNTNREREKDWCFYSASGLRGAVTATAVKILIFCISGDINFLYHTVR